MTLAPSPVWIVLALLVIAFGLLIALLGVVLIFATRYRKAAVGVSAIGLLVIASSLFFFWLAWPM